MNQLQPVSILQSQRLRRLLFCIGSLWLMSILLLGACAAPTATSPAPAEAPAEAVAADSADTSIEMASLNPAADGANSGDSAGGESEPAAAPVVDGPLVFGEDATIAGLDVSGMDSAEVESAINAHYAAILVLPIELFVGESNQSIRPAQVSLQLDIPTMLNEASQQIAASESVEVPLRLQFDDAALAEQLDTILASANTGPTIDVITTSNVFSRSFVFRPSRYLDVASLKTQIANHLESTQGAEPLELELLPREGEETITANITDIRQQVDLMASNWNGVVGLYLYDLDTGSAAIYNGSTVFSAASVMKVAIMLQAYINLPTFTPDTQDALEAMIIESDNAGANAVLAASINGSEPRDAYQATQQMNATLKDLGLQYTYMNTPYNADTFLEDVDDITISGGPAQEGSPPYTKPDPLVRTTPAEIGRIFLLIDECSKGFGELLIRYSENLSPERCQEMLDLLAQNADNTRMRAGLPADVHLAHKSGWVSDMQADVGIVRSPGGNYVLAIYVWRNVDELSEAEAKRAIAGFSHLIYSAYNPTEVTE